MNHANGTVADPVNAILAIGSGDRYFALDTNWSPAMVRIRFTDPLTDTSSLGTTGEVKRVLTVPPLCHVEG